MSGRIASLEAQGHTDKHTKLNNARTNVQHPGGFCAWVLRPRCWISALGGVILVGASHGLESPLRE